ncbi:MAG TPA: 50S ribosomal protein L11 methyltransferase [Dehalococcoidia bacterium]
MEWMELTVTAARADAEAVADVLHRHAGGVAVEEDIEVLDEAAGYRVRPESPVVLRAYLPVSDGSSERVWAARRDLDALPLSARPEVALRKVREEEWADAWKEFFQVERVGRRTVIRPTWRPYEPRPGDVVIHLDPGMAFGTGQHPTTRMCLAALEDLVTPGARVVDVGTGSGILAIAAVGLGAAAVLALDTDPVAVEAARRNVQANGAAARVTVLHGSLDGGTPVPLPEGSADLAVANINAAAVTALAPALRRLLRPGGVLVASGIIAQREAAVLRRLRHQGFRVLRRDAEGDWRTVIARTGPAEAGR